MLFLVAGRSLALVAVLTASLSIAQSSNMPQSTSSFSTLHFFAGSDGSRPVAPLARDSSGNLFGTTSMGGNTNCPSGCGVVFKVTPTGEETNFYSFKGGSDGALPFAGLIRDSAGNFYGTTDEGGGCSSFIDGCGTVFKLSPTGQETVLHRFEGYPGDGEFPFATVVRDSSGNLYGSTISGGPLAYGTVFKISVTGQYSILYTFTGGFDGASPAGTLVRDSAGNLYGTTTAGGAFLEGNVFKLSPSGRLTVLHSFNTSGGDAQGAWSGLVRNAAGNLYGTSLLGGGFGQGTVFEVNAAGQEHVMYSFTGGPDGGLPLSTPILDAAGNLYGTTQASSNGSGTVFKLDPQGHETVLYTFTPTGESDGATPQAGVIRDSSGNLYGTTEFGGSFNSGLVFKLTP